MWVSVYLKPYSIIPVLKMKCLLTFPVQGLNEVKSSFEIIVILHFYKRCIRYNITDPFSNSN